MTDLNNSNIDNSSQIIIFFVFFNTDFYCLVARVIWIHLNDGIYFSYLTCFQTFFHSNAWCRYHFWKYESHNLRASKIIWIHKICFQQRIVQTVIKAGVENNVFTKLINDWRHFNKSIQFLIRWVYKIILFKPIEKISKPCQLLEQIILV